MIDQTILMEVVMNTAADQLESRLTFDAVARRRRMRDRQAKRRLSQIALVTTAVFAAASLFSPERPAVRSASIAPNARGPLTTARLSANAAASASLPLPPSWRPAGEVLKRKATKAPTLPFGVDPRDVARRESLSRWHGIYAYATRYRLKPDLSRRIYDAAVTAGLEPLAEISAMAFRQGSLAEPILQGLDRSHLDGQVIHRLAHGHGGAPEGGRGGEVGEGRHRDGSGGGDGFAFGLVAEAE